MRDAIRTVTAATTFAMSAVLIFPSQAAATTVDHFFNSMSEEEESAYILTMARAARNILNEAGKPLLARRVETLFPDGPKQGGGGGAMEQFKDSADAFMREEMVREAAGEESRDGPVLVEEMMVKELRSHQIEIPPSFMAAAKAGKLKEVATRPGLPAASRSVPSEDDPIGSGGFITPPPPPKGAQ